MEKKVRICTDKLFAIAMFVVLAVFIAIALLVAAYSDLEPILSWICLVAAIVFVWEYAYWADCTENEICVTRLGILKRHISAERISSIQLIAWRRKSHSHLYVVICLDGHRPYNCHNLWMRLFFGLWYLSPKVIAIRIMEYQSKEYIQKLTELYGNVSLEESFIKWQKR